MAACSRIVTPRLWVSIRLPPGRAVQFSDRGGRETAYDCVGCDELDRYNIASTVFGLRCGSTATRALESLSQSVDS